MKILVDGYNLIPVDDHLRTLMRVDQDEARQGLLRMLGDFRRERGHKITCVFDGGRGGRLVQQEEKGFGVTVIFTPMGKSADDVIAELCAAATGDKPLVVTSDRGLIARVEPTGAEVMRSGLFHQRMMEAKVGLPPEEAESEPGPKPKKGPAKRPKKRDRRRERVKTKL